MSQLLARIAKMSSSSKHGLCFRSLSTAATPYLLFQPTDKEVTTASGEAMADLNVYDPRKNEIVKIPEQTLTKELLTWRAKWSSRGWVFAEKKDDWTYEYRLSNMLNPCSFASSRKVISLPPTKYLISSFSLSASPDQDDCVVAALSRCWSLIVCRPGDSEWTPIKVPFYPKEIIYSERDGQFYLNKSIGRKYNGPIDLVDTSSGFPQMSLYQPAVIDPNSDFPFFGMSKGQHIVESPSGGSFIVYWFSGDMTTFFWDKYHTALANKYLCQSSIKIKPRAFVVVRHDPENNSKTYTEDIGDLCIFLGANEDFCVSATEYPGLKPNSIYFASPGSGFGIYDLSSNTFQDVVNTLPHSCCYIWLAPLQ